MPGLYKGVQKGIEIAIPLVMQAQRLKSGEKMAQAKMDADRQKLMEETVKANGKIIEDRLKDNLGRAVQAGDREAYNKTASVLMSSFPGYDFPTERTAYSEDPNDLAPGLTQNTIKMPQSPQQVAESKVRLERTLAQQKDERDFEQQLQLEAFKSSLKPSDRSVFGKQLEEMFNLDPEDPNYQTKLVAYQNELAPKGIEIESDGKGGFTFKTGVPQTGKSEIAKKTQGTIEDELLNTTKAYQKAIDIRRLYKPEYQQLGTRWSALATKWKEKLSDTPIKEWASMLVNMDITDQDRTMLKDYAEYRMEAIDQLNKYIKLITGAQMSEKEAERLTKGMPDPGQGLFDGDSPSEFERKLNSKIKDLSRYTAKLNYMRKNGLKDPDNLSLDEMDGIIREFAQNREKDFIQTGKDSGTEIPKDLLRKLVIEDVRNEFGIFF